jgi:hypothetical protein
MFKKAGLLSVAVIISSIFIVIIFNSSDEKVDGFEVSSNPADIALALDNEFPEPSLEIEKTEEFEEKTSFSEQSKFNERCLSVVGRADENINLDNISVSEQKNMANIFNGCIYEIDMELALIERQFERTAENLDCLNKAYEVRDYLLELGTDAQNFSDMPNSTDSDRVRIAESYSELLENIFKNGRMAMNVRTNVCANNG